MRTLALPEVVGRLWRERSAALIFIGPLLFAPLHGLTEGKAVEPAWVEALVVGPACHLPLQWGHNGLKCCLFLEPLYPAETLNWGSNFPLEDVDINADLELLGSQAVSVRRDALRGPFQL